MATSIIGRKHRSDSDRYFRGAPRDQIETRSSIQQQKSFNRNIMKTGRLRGQPTNASVVRLMNICKEFVFEQG